MSRRRIDRANPNLFTRELFSAIETGLSGVYPARPNATDLDGWLFKPGFPPSYAGFGRIRAALTVSLCRSLLRRRAFDIAAGGCGLAAVLASAGSEVVVNDLRTEVFASMSQYDVDDRHITTVGGNVFDLEPDELGLFDLIVANEVIEHVAHPDQLLAHLARFLAPGGRILMTTPNGMYFRNKLPTFREIEDPVELESKQFKPDADGHLFLLTPREIAEISEDAGMAVESMFVWGTPLLTGHVGLRRLAGRWVTPLARSMENVAQRFPTSVRGRVCFSLVATLAKP